jgi:hypothetical protein
MPLICHTSAKLHHISHNSLVLTLGMVTQHSVWLQTGRLGSIPGRDKGLSLLPPSRPALRPTQPRIQWVPGVLPPRVKRSQGLMLTTHPYLVPKSVSRSFCSFPHSACNVCTGQLYFFHATKCVCEDKMRKDFLNLRLKRIEVQRESVRKPREMWFKN